MKPFRWCFIGTGTLAKQVAKEITASGRHEISAVYSRRLPAAQEFAEKFGGTAYETAEEAMQNADAVYIVTPHTSHYQYAKQAIELGKPTLCEKPFTVKAAETRELFDLAREKKVYLVEGMWTWFAPVAIGIRNWLEQGAVGEILQVSIVHSVNVVNYAPRLTDPNVAGGALLDTGVYPVTYLYRLFGKPVAVKCSGKIGGGVDLSDEIELTFEGGLTWPVKVAIDDPANEEYIRITGSKGEIFADHFHYTDRAELRDPSGQAVETVEGPTSMLNEFDCVAAEIREGRTESAYVPPQATIEVMEILDECRRQIGLVYPFEK